MGTKSVKQTREPKKTPVKIKVNGQWHEFEPGRDLEPETTLSYLLREKLGFTGLKIACDEGACGACTVLMDGKAVLSCMKLAVEADGHEILAKQCEPGYGTALQCGYCTPGFVMAAKSLLNENPKPTTGEIKEGLSGNICRCGCYSGIARAVQHASEGTAPEGEKK